MALWNDVPDSGHLSVLAEMFTDPGKDGQSGGRANCHSLRALHQVGAPGFEPGTSCSRILSTACNLLKHQCRLHTIDCDPSITYADNGPRHARRLLSRFSTPEHAEVAEQLAERGAGPS